MKTIILVGGSGKRLWPLSRASFPKQFLKLPFLKKSLFQMSFERASRISDEIFVVTNEHQKFLVLRDLENLGVNFPEKNILIEPEAKNTLPAIVYGMQFVDDCALILPSDHLIKNEEKFVETVKKAEQASKNYLVTFGIKPDKPKTTYGYIKHEAGMVREFKEKPDEETAKEYINNGYLWNAGIFLFNKDVFIKELVKANPELKEVLHIKDVSELYKNLPAISIDYGLMERSSRIAVFPLDVGWNDLGSFEAIYEEFGKDENMNAAKGDVAFNDSKNNLVLSDKKVCLIGVDNIIVVDSPDALLVSGMGSSYRVKDMVRDSSLRPWGSFKVLEESDGFKVKKITVLPGKRLSLQMHNYRDEHWIVVKGRAYVTNGDKEFVLNENETTFIPKKTKHRLANRGNEILEVIETQFGKYLGEDDIVRFEDDYGRSD